MSFLSQHLLKQGRHTTATLAELINRTTGETISKCQTLIRTQITQGGNFHRPDGLRTLAAIDQVSNECCRVIDSSLLLYKNYSATEPALQKACTDSMDQVNEYFAALNSDRRLLNTLLAIHADHTQISMMDPDDLLLLGLAIKDLNTAQRSANEDPLQHRVQLLHRQFMRNLAQEPSTLSLSKIELSTIPLGRKLLKTYETLFTKDNEVREVAFTSRQHFEMAKYSHFPQVRERYFRAITQRGPNTDIVKELITIRQQLAGPDITYF